MQPNRNDVWVQPYSGGKFYIYRCTKDDINFRDIAESLAKTCRFHGHLKTFYSVAQHMVHVSEYCGGDGKVSLWGNTHDGHETYIGDMNSPLKKYLEQWAEGRGGCEYKAAADVIDVAVQDKLNCHPSHEARDLVKIADMRMLVTEATQLHPQGVHPDWRVDTKQYPPYPDLIIRPWGWEEARDRWLVRLRQLTGVNW